MLTIEYMKTSDLIPYAGNAKRHPQSQIDQIAQSIKDFGFNDPVAIDENGVIICGHGRYFAARQLGIDTIPVIRLSGLSEQQRRAYALIHNKLTMNSGFDLEALQFELDNITDFDMTDFDFEIPEVFSMDDLEPVQGYDAHNDTRDYFESAFTFPTALKAEITSYLRKNKARITQEIIAKSTEKT